MQIRLAIFLSDGSALPMPQTPPQVTMGLGQFVSVVATFINDDGSVAAPADGTITWSVDNTSVVTFVRKPGGNEVVATAVAPGIANVKCQVGSIFQTAQLTVSTGPQLAEIDLNFGPVQGP